MIRFARQWLRPGDIVVLAAAIGLVAGLWLAPGAGGNGWNVVVTRAGGPDFELPAWTTQEISIDGPLGTTNIEIHNGMARVVSSPCSRKICMLEGWLEQAGDTAACVPNRVAVSLQAADPRFDAVNF